jgi:hypothetical protein
LEQELFVLSVFHITEAICLVLIYSGYLPFFWCCVSGAFCFELQAFSMIPTSEFVRWGGVTSDETKSKRDFLNWFVFP